MISIKIDVAKITKDRLFKGAKGTYLNAVLIETPDGQYGDFMICEDQTKEEREARAQRVILGNGKYVGRNGGQSGKQSSPQPRQGGKPPSPPIDEDVPFAPIWI